MMVRPGIHRLSFTVRDTGRGISNQQRSRLFKKFSQADSSTTREFGGTGLGLALSRKLARALGGDIVLEESTYLKGSTFVVTIDVCLALDKKPIDKSRHPVSQRQLDENSLSGTRILLVEDSLDNQFLIEHILSDQGVEVEVANDGLDGVFRAMHEEYDLVLMDVQMPNMDGHEATRTLRSQGIRTPIVALSAHAMKEEREKSLSAGCNCHITKPIDPQELKDTIRQYKRRPVRPTLN
jgi:CheY-like chemotaxis protein